MLHEAEIYVRWQENFSFARPWFLVCQIVADLGFSDNE